MFRAAEPRFQAGPALAVGPKVLIKTHQRIELCQSFLTLMPPSTSRTSPVE